MREWGGLALGVVVLLAAVTHGGRAEAQGWEWRRGALEPRLRPDQGGLAGELTVFAGEVGNADALLVSPRFGAWYAPDEHVELSADWGFAAYRERDADTDRTLRVGNPVFSGYYVGRGRSVDVRVGLSVAMPVAGDVTGHKARAYQMARATRGEWNRWAWLTETVTVAAPIRVETRGNRPLLLAVEGGLGIPIRLGGDDVDAVLQAAGEVGYRGERGAVGLRLQSVWQASEPDFAQLSLEPFARVRFGQGFAMARLTMNLDGPHGFAFESDGIWGLHMGAGLHL